MRIIKLSIKIINPGNVENQNFGAQNEVEC